MEKNLVKFAKLSKELNTLCQKREIMTRKQLNLGRIECDLLQYLHDLNTAICMNDIAEKLNVSHSRITRLIDTLVEKGLVERFASRRDRRSWLAKITAKGRKIASESIQDLMIIQEKLIEMFPTENIDEIFNHVMIYLTTYNELLREKEIARGK
ncbi:MAG: MarR family transcriptional regulator [Candidatus Stygibacter australis]|nr:MarR family transcriptional regulator [Candidatus Stygibacter australis]MDP8322823.1 MarR family transcriptional regulator [Candidatus Stygibacter australis]